MLEQKIAGVLVANIQNIKTFKADENTDASTIPIPIYDVYYALLNNSVIDIDHFTAADASETEQKIAAALERKQEEIFQKGDSFFGDTNIYEIFIENGKNVAEIPISPNAQEAGDSIGAAVSKIFLNGADVKSTMEDLEDELTTKFK